MLVSKTKIAHDSAKLQRYRQNKQYLKKTCLQTRCIQHYILTEHLSGACGLGRQCLGSCYSVLTQGGNGPIMPVICCPPRPLEGEHHSTKSTTLLPLASVMPNTTEASSASRTCACKKKTPPQSTLTHHRLLVQRLHSKLPCVVPTLRHLHERKCTVLWTAHAMKKKKDASKTSRLMCHIRWRVCQERCPQAGQQ